MHAEIVGPQGAPDLVLLHGGIGTGRYHWSKLVPALSASYRVHLPDLPGHGATPLPSGGRYDRDVLVDAVAAYLEHLDAPPLCAGFSMGGHALLALVERDADAAARRLAALVLVGVSFREHPGLGAWRERFDPDRLAAEYPVWARALAKIHAPLGPDAWRDVLRRDSGGLRVDVDAARLRSFQRPILLVRGDRDPAVDARQYAELREVWPHADELVVPAGGHDVQLTRADLVRVPLLDFLERARG